MLVKEWIQKKNEKTKEWILENKWKTLLGTILLIFLLWTGWYKTLLQITILIGIMYFMSLGEKKTTKKKQNTGE